MKRTQISGLAAGLAMMAAAAGLACAEPMRPHREPDPEVPVDIGPRRKRGPMPKPSKPMSEDYRANVQSQWGFSTKRLEALRRDWLKIDAKDRPKWHNYLGHKRNRKHQLEGYQP